MSSKTVLDAMRGVWNAPVPPATVHVIYRLAEYAAELAVQAEELTEELPIELARDQIAARYAVQSALVVAIEAAVPADKLTGEPLFAAMKLIKAIRGKSKTRRTRR